jgi:two-component system chemotaxis sensor kinase CheA
MVIKPLAPYLASLPGISGASILGDGGVVLILDPSELMALATEAVP